MYNTNILYFEVIYVINKESAQYSSNFVEYLVPMKNNSSLLMKKLGIVALLIALSLVGAVFILSFVPMLMVVYLGLVGILGWYLWQFVSIEFEYSIAMGEIDMDIIYGQRQRKELMSCRVRDMEIIHPLDDSGKKTLADCDHVDDCSISRKKPTPDVYYFTYSENGKKYGMIFEATKKTLDIMKFYNASALTYSNTLRH